jgi:hypothetical protein
MAKYKGDWIDKPKQKNKSNMRHGLGAHDYACEDHNEWNYHERDTPPNKVTRHLSKVGSPHRCWLTFAFCRAVLSA